MAVTGYNFYLNGVKVTSTPQASPTYTFTGLPSATGYEITATAVDAAGNESDLSEVLAASTLEYTPSDDPISTDSQMAIDEIVADSMAANGQRGVIVSITGPAGYYHKAYGYTAAAGGRPVTTDDHFRMGSITKTFVAMAAFQQVDAGNLSLGDTVDQYVAGIPNGDIITIENLLTMRSGLPDYTTDFLIMLQVFFFPTSTISRDQILGVIRGSTPQFTPGSQFAYSNSNAVLVGEVLQEVTGRTIRDILLEDIIAPLGMVETTWPLTADIPEPAMSGSRWTPTWSQEAGCLTTTARDLTRWAEAIRDGDLLSPLSHSLWTETFWGQPFDAPPITTIGYGHFAIKWGRLVGHGGSITGFDSACVFDPVSGATIIVANNAQTSTASAFYGIAREVADLLYPGSMVQPTYSKPELP